MTTIHRPAGLIAAAILVVALTAGRPAGASAGTVVGDAGHFLRYVPKVYFHNPDGRAFTVTVHLMRWPIASWNPTNVTLRLSDPAGLAVVDGTVTIEGQSKTFDVPAGAKGAYLLEMNLPAKHVFHGPDFWVSLRSTVPWSSPATRTNRRLWATPWPVAG